LGLSVCCRLSGGVHLATRGVLCRARLLLLRDGRNPGRERPRENGPEKHRAIWHRRFKVGARQREEGRGGEYGLTPVRAVLRHSRHARRTLFLSVGGKAAKGYPRKPHPVSRIFDFLPPWVGQGSVPPLCPY